MMKFGYQFSNLLGTVYSGGNILFTPDGNSVISPVGNRLTVFDLVNHNSITLPIETHRDIKIIALSPNGKILIASDENGYTAIINLQRHVQLGECKFKETPSSIEFSPNGSMVAFGIDRRVYIYKSPIIQKSLNPMVRLSLFQHSQKIVSLDWSNDSKKLLIACKGGTLFVREGNDRPHLFQVQGSQPVRAYFGNKDSTLIFAVSKKGLVQWRYMSEEEIKLQKLQNNLSTENPDIIVTTENLQQEKAASAFGDDQKNRNKRAKGRWIYTSFNRFETSQSVRVKSCQYHKIGGLLVIGLSNGLFTLHQMPEYQELYRLNISNQAITSVAFNSTGEWMAFASKELGQLLVWEWRSETYILKQQGHSYNMSTMAYSPDGQTIATGGDDGKVKIWNTQSGYCFVTFSEHEAPVTAIRYSPVGSQNAVFSASLDGTVRAFDLLRYRNFRTFVSPNKSQFSSLAIDAAGEIVVAGCVDTFEIYVWSIRTGRLTDVLSGHTSPVSSVAFDPSTSMLASGSWDKTIRVWDLFEDGATKENIINKSDVLAIAYSPDGSRFAVSTLDGSIQIFETANWTQVGIIDGRHDIMGGRAAADQKMVKNSASGRAFSRIAFTPNGQCLIAGGDSKYICIYHVDQQILLKKYQTSHNMSLDGIFDNHTWRKVTEFGHVDMMEEDYEEDEKRHEHSLPGVKRGDLAKRSTKKKIKTFDLAISPTGRAWAATTTEGLMIYSLDENLFFDPTDLSMDINPESIRSTLNDKEYLKALIVMY
ncbi:WD40 repeat-containing protein [Heterostelium album PN500]|uniref:WD40 repeat-containing protein n=1 Tax=Heterostelium pallidum (strain ATCC 26659 / Pp 5 / PN500) TaxID=670386 RepID=D3BQX1_HETP5|nr:WD40 repeat-containing protein [Heterostelium album PN500]EFA76157.1 WD40 repeat-containing protein [Heterostelium album PN500]|eukprot:XP_020428291.1 WD40 repeat-containing protein [Heterostelium album PN500]